jgi:hypothetical protein
MRPLIRVMHVRVRADGGDGGATWFRVIIPRDGKASWCFVRGSVRGS